MATQLKSEMGSKLITLRSFEEWLVRWKGTAYLAERLGLLHSLITTEEYRWPREELVPFLLETADGYRNDRGHTTVATKAFAVLCLKFFKDGQQDQPPLWWWVLGNEALFQKVLWFLRIDNKVGWRLLNYNYPVSDSANTEHPQRVFRLFLEKFTK